MKSNLELRHELSNIVEFKDRLEYWYLEVAKKLRAIGIRGSDPFLIAYQEAFRSDPPAEQALRSPIPKSIFVDFFEPYLDKEVIAGYRPEYTTSPLGHSLISGHREVMSKGSIVLHNYEMDIEAEDWFRYHILTRNYMLVPDHYRKEHITRELSRIESERAKAYSAFSQWENPQAYALNRALFDEFYFYTNTKTQIDAEMIAKYDLYYKFLQIEKMKYEKQEQ